MQDLNTGNMGTVRMCSNEYSRATNGETKKNKSMKKYFLNYHEKKLFSGTRYLVPVPVRASHV
jgi:hypothetical protein